MSNNKTHKNGSDRQSTASSSSHKLRRINVLDVSCFREYQTVAKFWSDFVPALAQMRNDPNGELTLGGLRLTTSLLDRIEQHVNHSGPIFVSKGWVNTWDTKDLVFWNSLEKYEAEIADEMLVILWVLSRIDLHCPMLEEEAA